MSRLRGVEQLELRVLVEQLHLKAANAREEAASLTILTEKYQLAAKMLGWAEAYEISAQEIEKLL